jgi:hypothetical protein
VYLLADFGYVMDITQAGLLALTQLDIKKLQNFNEQPLHSSAHSWLSGRSNGSVSRI